MTEEASIDAEEAETPLPTIAGVAVSAANTAAGKALLSPAAEAFGRYFGERAEEITARWRSERRANAERMQKRVSEKEGAAIRKSASERQAELLIEWFEASSDVDESDPELSQLWEAVLSEIYKNSASSRELLNVAKGLNSDDIHLLSSIDSRGARWTPEINRDLEKLRKLGLIYLTSVAEAVFYHANMWVISCVVMIPFMIAAGALGFDPNSAIPDPILKRTVLATMIIFLTACFTFIGTRIYYLANRAKLTSFGEGLISSLSRYSGRARI